MKLTATAIALGALLTLPAGAQNQRTIRTRHNLTVASSANMEHIPPHKRGLSNQDRKFLMAIDGVNRSEILFGKLAERNGGTWARGYGRDMAREHGLAMAALNKLAKQEGITLPSDVPYQTKQMLANLRRRHGQSFDTAYRRMMMAGHREALAKVEREMRNGHDAKVRSYAVMLEPQIKLHLKLAQQEATMTGTNRG